MCDDGGFCVYQIPCKIVVITFHVMLFTWSRPIQCHHLNGYGSSTSKLYFYSSLQSHYTIHNVFLGEPLVLLNKNLFNETGTHTHTDLKLMAIIKRETLDPFVGHIFTLHPAHKHRYYIRSGILWRPFLLSLYRLESHSKISHSLWMRSHSMQLHVIGCYENVQLLKISNLIRRFSTPPFMLSSPWLLLLFFFFN